MRMLLSWGLLALSCHRRINGWRLRFERNEDADGQHSRLGARPRGIRPTAIEPGRRPIRRAIIKSPIRCIRWCKSTPRWAISP